jgi:hypothetical protein
MTLLHDGGEIVDEIITNSELSQDQRHDLVSAAIFSVATHVDRNSLYIDEELGAHCVALFMGTEDIHHSPEAKRQELQQRYYHMRKETHRMILEDSGVAKVNRLFRSINRPKITSPVIEAIRELRKEKRKKVK